MTPGAPSPTSHVDAAIEAVGNAAMMLRDLGPGDPAVVSATIAAVRELCWRIDSLTTTIAATYQPGRCLAHDQGHDPATAVTAITGGLTVVRQHLAALDQAFGGAHNHAAHLYTPTGRTRR